VRTRQSIERLERGFNGANAAVPGKLLHARRKGGVAEMSLDNQP